MLTSLLLPSLLGAAQHGNYLTAAGEVEVAGNWPTTSYYHMRDVGDKTTYRFTAPANCHVDSVAVHMWGEYGILSDPVWDLGICRDSLGYPRGAFLGTSPDTTNQQDRTWYVFPCTASIKEDTAYHVVARIVTDNGNNFTLSAHESLWVDWAGQSDDTLQTLWYEDSPAAWHTHEGRPIFVLYTDSGPYSTISQDTDRNWMYAGVWSGQGGSRYRAREKLVFSKPDSIMRVWRLEVMYMAPDLDVVHGAANPHGNLSLVVLDSTYTESLGVCDSVWGQASPEDTCFWVGADFNDNDTVIFQDGHTYYIQAWSTNDDAGVAHRVQWDSLPAASQHLTYGDSTSFYQYYTIVSDETTITDYKHADLIFKLIGNMEGWESKIMVID